MSGFGRFLRFKPLEPLSERWPNLPDTYGEGQRRYDMAATANRVAEEFAWPASLCAAALLWKSLGSAWWLTTFPLLYWLVMRPYRIWLEEASNQWEQERNFQPADSEY